MVQEDSKPALGAIDQNNVMYSIATSSGITVGNINSTNATGTVVLPANVGRTWAVISNNSGVSILCNYNNYLAFATTSAALGGFVVAASSTWQILPNALYTGQVDCVGYGATSSVYVEESIGNQ